MKNIQVIDDALNCLYEIYEASDADFLLIFPDARDIEFADDFVERVGESRATEVLERLWDKPLEKPTINGLHGTLFYGEANRKRRFFFPTKKESEMVPLPTDMT